MEQLSSDLITSSVVCVCVCARACVGDSGSVRMYHLWHVLLSQGFHITFHPNLFRYMHYALMARMHGVQIVLNRASLVAR